MLNCLTKKQVDRMAGFRQFADSHIIPRADEIDALERLPASLIDDLANAGLLGSMLPEELGGCDLDAVSYGLLSEELGRSCQSVRNFVAVQDMVVHALQGWGSLVARKRWLPRICGGQAVAAFAMTEPDVGSDAASVRARAVGRGDTVELHGVKKWISFGQIAQLILVFAQFDEKHTAFLVQRDNPGLTVEPLTGMLGLRGSMLAELRFDGCRVPLDHMIGRPGSGLIFIGSSSLDLGRYSTAWGAIGLTQACCDLTTAYSASRVQFGVPISEHQLIARMQADMLSNIMATRLLCHYAGLCRTAGSMNAETVTLMAKYRSSALAVQAAGDTVQILGAHGLSPASAAQRHYRDAKVLEIIEGTTQLHQIMIGQITTDPWRENLSSPSLTDIGKGGLAGRAH